MKYVARVCGTSKERTPQAFFPKNDKSIDDWASAVLVGEPEAATVDVFKAIEAHIRTIHREEPQA